MKRNTKSAKVMAAALTALLITGVTVPVCAAEDTDQPVSVTPALGGDASETVGNITITKDYENNGTQFAAYVVAPEETAAELNVEGSVSTAASKVGENEYTGVGYGVGAQAFGNSATANISGDVQVSGDDTGVFSIGAHTMAAGDTASVSIDGDLSVTSGSGYGIMMEGGSSGKTSVEIGGDLKVENQGYACGIGTHGGDLTQEVVINGDVTVTSENYEAVAFATGGLDATTNIEVGGNVSSSTTGLEVYVQPDVVPTVDVLIEGTLSAKENPVRLVGEKGDADITLTAWEIVPNADGKIVTGEEGLEDMASKLESNILYIIRLEQPKAGGTVALEGTTDSHGFAAAKEGETVTLKATVQNGYKLAGAYNGTTALTLLDKDGNYYIVVPKGGGVSLSVLLEQIQSNVIPTVPETPATETTEEAPVAEKQLIDELAVPVADSEAEIAFYDDSTFVITLADGTEVEGTFAFVDGKLTFNGVELEITIDEEDGSYHCVYTTEVGEKIEFILDAEFVEKLMAAVEG